MARITKVQQEVRNNYRTPNIGKEVLELDTTHGELEDAVREFLLACNGQQLPKQLAVKAARMNAALGIIDYTRR